MSQPREYKVVSHDGRDNSEGNPLHPFNGNLEKTLEKYSNDGWMLISYNWGSWRHMIMERVKTEATDAR